MPPSSPPPPTASLRIHTLNAGLLLLRLITATVGIAHGGQKLFGLFGGHGMQQGIDGLTKMGVPMPVLSAYLSAGAEFFGGLLIGLGLLTRPAAAVWTFNFLVAVLMVHRAAFFAPAGMEYPLTLAVIGLTLLLTGPGRFSLDALIFRRGPR